MVEVHQPVVDRLLQHHHTLLVGNRSHHLPIRAAQWRAFGHGLRVHFCRLRRKRCGLLDGRNGLHVCKSQTNPTITNVLQRSGGWRTVSVVDEFLAICAKVLGLDSR